MRAILERDPADLPAAEAALQNLAETLAAQPDQATLQKLLNQASLVRDGAAVAQILSAVKVQTRALLVLDRPFFSPVFQDPELIIAHPDYVALWSDPALDQFRVLRTELGHMEGLPAVSSAGE
jgi:hypothetical protein